MIWVYHSESSDGLNKGLAGMLPNHDVRVTGVTVGAALIPGSPTFGATVTNYSEPAQLPSWVGKASVLLSPDDLRMIGMRKACKEAGY